MITDPLALWAVEFDGSSLIAATETVAKLRKEFEKAVEWSDRLEQFDISKHNSEIRELEYAWERGQRSMRQYADTINVLGANFGMLYGKTMAWVQAGLQGTTQSMQLGVGMQFLSREIASVFTPTINAAIASIHSMVDWFHRLSGDQQAIIRNAVLLSAGFLGTVTVLKSVITHVQMLGEAMRVIFLHNPVLAITAAFVGMLMASKEGRNVLLDLAEAFKPVAVAMGEIVHAFAPLVDIVAQVFGFIATIIEPILSGFGKLIAYIITATVALKLLGVQMAAFNAISWANPFVLIAAAAASVFAIVKGMEWASGGPRGGQKREDLTLAGKGFESIETTWLRLQESVNKQDYARDQTEYLRQIAENTRRETRERIATGVAAAGRSADRSINWMFPALRALMFHE